MIVGAVSLSLAIGIGGWLIVAACLLLLALDGRGSDIP